ncbi:MAG TPA: hypothetical protein VJT15_24715 [Pyrinomonadaceae bacterium]|nr:hypothetical protein [Pyrinomonadaceae bacterium]
MSFDLYFCRPDGAIPSIPELKQYFSTIPFVEINDSADGGVQFWYQNEATGVYCDFSYSPLDANESEGCGSSGLSFNLNFVRPSFFAYETMPLVEAFCKHFNLTVEDSQEETIGPADAAQLIASWRSHNAMAMRSMVQLAKEEGMELHYLPEQQTTEWWRYMSVKQALEEAVTEDIFVPSLMILQSPANKLFTVIAWPMGIAQFFPPCDYVYVERENKRIFGTKQETGIVPYQSVLATIGPLLSDHEHAGLQLKYLSPEKTPAAAPLIQTLQLQPIVLSEHTQIASDNFHDVALPGEVSQ